MTTASRRGGSPAEQLMLVGRGVAGVSMLVAPTLVARVWLCTASPGARRFVRAIGVRDVVLCVGQVRARSEARDRWRRAAAASDLADAVFAVGWALARRRLVAALAAVPALGAVALTRAT